MIPGNKSFSYLFLSEWVIYYLVVLAMKNVFKHSQT